MQFVDIAEPGARMAMHEFGEVAHGGFPGFEQMLAFEIPLGARARKRRQMRGTMLGQAGRRPVSALSLMHCFVASGHDAHAIPIQVERAGQSRGLRRHGVRVCLVKHLGRRAD